MTEQTSLGYSKKRPLVFLGVGTFNTLVDFSFYTFLTSTAFRNGHHIALAGFISGTFALICAFLTHGFVTWRGSHLSRQTLVKFVLFTGFGMWVIRPALLSWFIHWRLLYVSTKNLIDHSGIHLSYNFISNTGSFALMLLIVLTYNYFTYERFVFTRKKPSLSHIEPENRSEF